MRREARGVGLAIVGAGRVGLFRGEVAARHPAVQWIGIAEKNHNRGLHVAEKIGADFVTQDHRELLKRPEVTCAIIATDEHLHVDPIMAAVEPAKSASATTSGGHSGWASTVMPGWAAR